MPAQTGYTITAVTQAGIPIADGAVAVTDPTLGSTSDVYDLAAGCYYLETFSAAESTAYSDPEAWHWSTSGATQSASGYGFDGGTFGVGGMICGITACYDTCRQGLAGLSDMDQCSNFDIMLKECSECDGDDRVAMTQRATDAACAGPEPWTTVDVDGAPAQQHSLVVTASHTAHVWHLTVLLQDALLPDQNVPTVFESRVVEALATYFDAYPYDLFVLVEINGHPAEDIMARRRLRGTVAGGTTAGTGETGMLAATTAARLHSRALARAETRKLTRLTFQLDAESSDQESRFDWLEAKVNDNREALEGQLRQLVSQLADADVLSVNAYPETRTMVDAVELQVKTLSPTPTPTPGPTASPANEQPGMVEKPQKGTSSSGGGGGVGEMSKYGGLALAALVLLGIAFCWISVAVRRCRQSKEDRQREEMAAAQRKLDDEAFLRAQASNGAKISLANRHPSSALPTPIDSPLR